MTHDQSILAEQLEHEARVVEEANERPAERIDLVLFGRETTIGNVLDVARQVAPRVEGRTFLRWNRDDKNLPDGVWLSVEKAS